MVSLKLDRFEDILLKSVAEKCGDKEKAIKIINTYLPVIRALHDNHDSSRIQAERYIKAYEANIDPKLWIEHINKTRKKYSRKSSITTDVHGENQSNEVVTVSVRAANPWLHRRAYKGRSRRVKPRVNIVDSIAPLGKQHNREIINRGARVTSVISNKALREAKIESIRRTRRSKFNKLY